MKKKSSKKRNNKLAIKHNKIDIIRTKIETKH